MKCEIIIVKYGLPKLEQECIDSVVRNTTGVDYSITAHDNYDADEGLAKVWNDLIRKSDAEYICLLNNDTRIDEPEWLQRLLSSIESDPSIGAIGPLTNHASGPQGKKNWVGIGKPLNFVRVPLVGFCMLFKKSVWKECGGFDERFHLYGEDSDFCQNLLHRKYKMAIRGDVFVFHHGKSSTPIAEAKGKDIAGIKEQSRELYRLKWKS